MFMGEHAHNMDAKGRLTIPAKFRDEIGERCVITRNMDKSLIVWTESRWKQVAEALSKKSMLDSTARALHRFYIGSAFESEFDAQGRVLIPPALKTFADLKKETVIVGTGAQIEIWSADNWKAYNEVVEPQIEQLAESLGDIFV